MSSPPKPNFPIWCPPMTHSNKPGKPRWYTLAWSPRRCVWSREPSAPRKQPTTKNAKYPAARGSLKLSEERLLLNATVCFIGAVKLNAKCVTTPKNSRFASDATTISSYLIGRFQLTRTRTNQS